MTRGLQVSDEGALRTLTLDRPEVRNALDRRLRERLLGALDSAAADPGVRAVVLTGAGRAFCSGMDLSELEGTLSHSAEDHQRDSRELAELFESLYRFPKPIVAAVNGHAIAGGAGLAGLCDYVVMAEEAKIGYTEARIGFVAALVGVFLARFCGERAARELLLRAEPVTAAEALGYRLVSEIRPAGEVLARAREVARTMAANSPQALAATKHLLADGWGLSLAEALRHAAEVNARAREGDELREGIRAFLERREPAWRSGRG